MRIIREINKSEAMDNFLARPRFALGVTIFFAGAILLLTEALKMVYR